MTGPISGPLPGEPWGAPQPNAHPVVGWSGGEDDEVGERAAARLRRRLREALAEQLPGRVTAAGPPGEPGPGGRERAIAREVLEAALAAHSEAELMANRALPDPQTEQRLITEVLDEVFGMAGLTRLLDDPAVETINANRFDRVFVQYADGHRARVGPVAGSDAELTELVRTLAARASAEERRFDRAHPAVNVQLPGGERLFAVMGLTSGGVSALSIRRHRYRTATLAQLRAAGSIDAGLEQFLAAMVRSRKNILITGGAGVGKTTLLRGLASQIDTGERLVTIEDAFELGLDLDPARHPDVTALQAREPNIEGQGAVSQSELVRWGLRMTPDRVIVGEIRGPELIPMCNAMSQGNDGSMATLHASSSRIAFTRLASYAAQGPERLPVEAAMLLVASAVHFVVHLAFTTAHRGGSGGRVRVVSSIREVVDAEGPQIISNEVYRPGPDRRARPIAGALRSETLDDLAEAGLDHAVLEQPAGWWPA